MVDTNSDPTKIDFPIPANDDASKSIALIVDYVASAVEEGLAERKMEKEKDIKNKKNAEKDEEVDEKNLSKYEQNDEDEDEGNYAVKSKAKKAPAKKARPRREEKK
jgi:small subunit ribosomal protein S2